MLRDGSQDVNGELVGKRHVGGYELHAGFHQGRYEGEISGEPIQLCDNQARLVLPAGFNRHPQLWPIGFLAALDLGELADQLPSPAFEVVGDGLPLRLQPEAALALPVGADKRRAALAFMLPVTKMGTFEG